MSNTNEATEMSNIYPPPPQPTNISPSSPSIIPNTSPVLSLRTPTHLSPSIHPPGFFDNPISRVSSSLARIGSDLPPLSSYTPFPPSTPQNHSPHIPRGLTRGLSVPPINTNLGTPSHAMASPIQPPFNSNPTPMVPLQEMSLMRWRAGQAVFIAGFLLVAIGLMVGLATSPTTDCKVPYMAYSYYDNYVPYANMECTTHPRGWYAGAPILTIGLSAVGLSWYYSWVKVQEMKLASKYHVAMV